MASEEAYRLSIQKGMVVVNRIIKHDLIESDRWLDLPSDTHRLVFKCLLLQVDDYANIEGGRRLYRWIRSFTQVKTDADAMKIMSDLQDAEMAMRYEVSGKEYWHLTRFYNSRWYWTRSCPQSPYPDDVDNPTKQRVKGKSDTHVNNMLPTGGARVNEEVKEEVEVIPTGKPAPDPRNAATWQAYCAAYASRYGVAPVRNASVNTCIANIVKRLGDESAQVATFYLTHNDTFYIKKQHSIKQLLADCEGLRTQWKRGKRVTGLEARSAEQQSRSQQAVEEFVRRGNDLSRS